MRKIGIMGGTFNPIHNGHLAIARTAYEQFSLEKVLFLPSKNPPHKKNLELAANEERAEMVKLAIKPYPFFEFSATEMEREGYSYTSDTLRVLKTAYPDYELCFIVGADSLHYMQEWHEPQTIFDNSHILCAPRYPNTKDEDYQCRKDLMHKYGASIDFIEMEPVDLSSKEFLQEFQEGKEVENQVPETVYAYILEHHLYENIKDYNDNAKETRSMDCFVGESLMIEENFSMGKNRVFSAEELYEILKRELPPKRYLHTIGVADTAACLSMRYGEDITKARIAGLLHDCAKCLPDCKIYERSLQAGIEISEIEKQQPFLLHAKLGACYAKKKFGITDEDILMAITYHTTGRPNMSRLEKIIFVADYIEPGRQEIPGLSEIRQLAFCNLEQAVYLTLENTLSYLKNQSDGKKAIDRTTINAYNYYKEKIERGIKK